MIVNDHFEPDLVWRNLSERLRRVTLHWPRYPEALGLETSTFCEPRKGVNVRNQTFTEGDAGKTCLFRSFFPHALEIAQPKFSRKDTTADGALRTLSRIDRVFMYLWQRRVIFTAILMFLTTLESGPYRVIMLRSESSCRNQLVVATKSSESPVGCPTIPVFCTLKRISDGHQYPDEPFAGLQGNH